jgi:hypothetical protein
VGYYVAGAMLPGLTAVRTSRSEAAVLKDLVVDLELSATFLFGTLEFGFFLAC